MVHFEVINYGHRLSDRRGHLPDWGFYIETFERFLKFSGDCIGIFIIFNVKGHDIFIDYRIEKIFYKLILERVKVMSVFTILETFLKANYRDPLMDIKFQQFLYQILELQST